MELAVFQLSQEIIHCLSPSGNTQTIVLDEGLATHFGMEYYAACGYTHYKITPPNYLNALGLVNHYYKLIRK
ncbi:MAG: hypothetical protein IPP79_20775 [Chitinophagaceae bacterium]|nr:hypothetical protein [Chitinophagaceae bacterium]